MIVIELVDRDPRLAPVGYSPSFALDLPRPFAHPIDFAVLFNITQVDVPIQMQLGETVFTGCDHHVPALEFELRSIFVLVYNEKDTHTHVIGEL